MRSGEIFVFFQSPKLISFLSFKTRFDILHVLTTRFTATLFWQTMRNVQARKENISCVASRCVQVQGTSSSPPHTHPMSCVAPRCVQVQGEHQLRSIEMCASARNVIIPTPPHVSPFLGEIHRGHGTVPATNMAPENGGPLERAIPNLETIMFGVYVSFLGRMYNFKPPKTLKWIKMWPT